ncbi:hypothetical protein HK097_007150, partial [Rhizophlyctis rosea]
MAYPSVLTTFEKGERERKGSMSSSIGSTLPPYVSPSSGGSITNSVSTPPRGSGRSEDGRRGRERSVSSVSQQRRARSHSRGNSGSQGNLVYGGGGGEDIPPMPHTPQRNRLASASQGSLTPVPYMPQRNRSESAISRKLSSHNIGTGPGGITNYSSHYVASSLLERTLRTGSPER